jgi:uncharacterized membrane protein YozB (DUF420 family)
VDPRILYWSAALVNMGCAVALALRGVRARRRGDVPSHRRHMLAASALVGLFLASYPLKLWWLGPEDLSTWRRADVVVLRIHESCVLTMLVAGGIAGARARRLARTRNATRDPALPLAPPALVRGHRRAGWTAVTASLLGLLTALLVLASMLSRARG